MLALWISGFITTRKVGNNGLTPYILKQHRGSCITAAFETEANNTMEKIYLFNNGALHPYAKENESKYRSYTFHKN